MLLLLLTGAFHIHSTAQKSCTATLCGVVTDAETKEPVPFAEIFIEGAGRGEVTDEQGKFHFHDLCEGDYIVICNHIGCAHIAKSVQVKGDAEVDFELHNHALELGEVVVREAYVAPAAAQAQREVSGASLKTVSQTLGDALSQLPGVNTLSTGASIDKPVIRGLHSNRVLLINNGVRQEGQQWGQEHGPEIDPQAADRVTVVMGANSVRYGPEALGGVILVEQEPLRKQKGIGGEATVAGNSNARSGLTAARLDGFLGEKLPLSLRLQGSLKRSGNLRAPDYFLENTGISEQNFAAAAGLQRRHFDAEVSYSLFSTDIGIFEGSHVETPEDLQAAIERGRPETDGDFSYTIAPPSQHVVHQIFKTKGSLRTGDAGKLLFQYARQANLRQEFEEHEEDDPGHGHSHDEDEPATELDLTTHTADLAWEHKPWNSLSGSLGIQYMQQSNTTVHGEILPDFNSHTTGVFWTEHWKKRPMPVELELGLRYDFRRLNIERQGGEIIDRTLDYSNLSGTAGVIYRLPKYLKLLFHAGSAWRAPSPGELYSDGVHHGSASYEAGRDDLSPERAYSTNLTLDFSTTHFGEIYPSLRANLSVYQNFVTDFIYLQPTSEVVETEDGAFPVFRYEQADARLRGMDWSAEWMPGAAISLMTGGSILRTLNRNTEEPLTLMPADRFRHSLTWFLKKSNGKRNDLPFLRLTVVNVLKQQQTPKNVDFAPAPDGYTLLNFDAGTSIKLDRKQFRFGLSVSNLLNTRYRDYLNRFRYFADQPGRDFAVWARVEF